jgi:ADP-ribose pyrophosphatase YjhB (NUDIX family)
METIKHFTATTFVVNKGRVLLHLHKKLGVWLPVGGHIEPNELPQEAALREISEEAGLAAVLNSPDKDLALGDAQQLIRPMHIILENIAPGHQHIDMIYYATAESDDLNPEDGETADLGWFSVEEVEKLEKIPQNAKVLALEAIDILAPIGE